MIMFLNLTLDNTFTLFKDILKHVLQRVYYT